MKKSIIALALTITALVIAKNPEITNKYPASKSVICTEKVKSIYQNSSWQESTKMENLFQSANLNKTNNYTNTGSGWNLSDYIDYSYDQQNNLSQRITTNPMQTKKDVYTWTSGNNTRIDYFTENESQDWTKTGQLTAKFDQNNKLIKQVVNSKEEMMGSYFFYKSMDTLIYQNGLLAKKKSKMGFAIGDSSSLEMFHFESNYTYMNNLPHIVTTKMSPDETQWLEVQWDTLSFVDNKLIRNTRKYDDESMTFFRQDAELDNVNLSFSDEFRMNLPLVKNELFEKLIDGIWIPDYKNTYTFAQTSIAGNNEKNDFMLKNYPNPFNPTTAINFSLAKSGLVKLAVYNAKGELVQNLVNSNLSSGSHSYTFDGSQLNSGVYFYKLETNGKSIVNKMILCK